jgi:hypothetical protein
MRNKLTLGLAVGLCLTASTTRADFITVAYDGTINTFGFNSTAFFQDRPETTIHGTFQYDTAAVGEPHQSLPFVIEFPLLDYSFEIDLPDLPDYLATDINFGRIQLVENAPRVDFRIQGLPIAPDLDGFPSIGVFFNLQDGFHSPTNPVLDLDPGVFRADSLPGPFSLTDLHGGGLMFLEWGTLTGTVRHRATFNITSLTASPSATAGEPHTVALLGFVIAAALSRSRARRRG